MAQSDRPLKLEVIDDDMVEILRKKSPAERIAIANGMWRFARGMLQQILKREHPEWSADQIEREVARRLSHGVV